MKDLVFLLLIAAFVGLLGLHVAGRLRSSRGRREPAKPGRILFPFVGQALSERVLDATLRLARLEQATLVPAYLVEVPMTVPLGAAIPRQCEEAMPLLEAVEQRALREHVPVDARIERGRTHRHALRELLEHESYDRVVVAADTTGADGFDAGDIAWLLSFAEGEILVLRPAHDRLLARA